MALALGMGAMPAGHAFRYPDLRYRRIEPALEPDRQCAGRAGAVWREYETPLNLCGALVFSGNHGISAFPPEAMTQMVATFAATGGYAG